MTETPHRTAIIIGAGRSGTKFLRGVLAASSGTATVPYDVNYIWRQGNENAPSDELDPATCTEDMARAIRRALMRQAGMGRDEPHRLLLEKSVPNTLRVPYVARVFPQARFLHLVRDGRDVVESAYRNWTARPDLRYLLGKARTFPLRNWRYALWYMGHLVAGRSGNKRQARTWGPRYLGIDRDLQALPLEVVVARQWVRCIEKAREGLAHLPADQVLEIRYEDLVRSPSTVERAARFLELPDPATVVTRYEARLRAPEARSGWRRTFTEGQRRRILEEIGPTLDQLGYGRE